MHTSPYHHSAIKNLPSLPSSMDTEVNLFLYFRSRSCHLCWKTLCTRALSQFQLQERSLWSRSQRNFPQNGRTHERRKGEKINQRYSKGNERKGQRAKLWRVIPCRLHGQCLAHHTRIHLRSQRWWLKRSCLRQRGDKVNVKRSQAWRQDRIGQNQKGRRRSVIRKSQW